MCGNPTQLSGTFYDAFHRDRAFWKTFTFSSIDSDLVSDTYVETMKGKYGEDSNIYSVRVLGEFPDQADDNVISLADCERAVINNPSPDPKLPVYVGVDVARFGDDKTVIVVRQGDNVLSMKDYSKRSTMETAGYVQLIINSYKNKEIVVNVDESGLGGGVVDRLEELNTVQNVVINGVNNGSKSSNDGFVNLGCELWWNMRENIKDWGIPDDEELVGQLSTRKYKMSSGGKIMLERKEQMKERGLASPDKADALSLAFCEHVSTSFILDV
jgi:hypothetical protein